MALAELRKPATRGQPVERKRQNLHCIFCTYLIKLAVSYRHALAPACPREQLLSLPTDRPTEALGKWSLPFRSTILPAPSTSDRRSDGR